MITEVCVCPTCKGTLISANQGFRCDACSQEYPIVDGIPDFFLSQPEDEEDQHWRENLVWLDPQMAEARDTIYSLSVREMKGMTFAMQQLGPLTFSGCRILEVGTGTGHFARWMAEVSASQTEIYALDFSWPMFEYAKLHTADQPGVVLLRANSTGKLPFRNESFDFVFLRLAPLGEHRMDNVQASLQLLKPGGWLFKAGWDPRTRGESWTEAVLKAGYECAETHEWLYPRTKTPAEYAASRVEAERAIAFGAPIVNLPEDPVNLVSMICETLRIARKPG